jgi:hypothetical protein
MPKCIVRFVAAQPGAAEAMLFIGPGEGFLLEQDAQGTWRRTATVSGAVFCDTVRQGLAGADVKVEPHAWPDFTVGEHRLVILPLSVPCRPVSR